MTAVVIETIIISSLLVCGVWGVTAEGMLLNWMRYTPVLESKVITGECPCPASFYTPIVFIWSMIANYDILVMSRNCAIDLWDIATKTQATMLSIVITLMALAFSMLGTAGILYLVRQALEYMSLKNLVDKMEELER